VYEATRVDAIHAALTAKGLLPSEHFADGAYLSAALLVRSRRDHGVRLLGLTKPSTGWQGRDGGLTADAFQVDWRRRRVTCPAGQTSSTWRIYATA
jgi:transposase